MVLTPFSGLLLSRETIKTTNQTEEIPCLLRLNHAPVLLNSFHFQQLIITLTTGALVERSSTAQALTDLERFPALVL